MMTRKIYYSEHRTKKGIQQLYMKEKCGHGRYDKKLEDASGVLL